MTLRRATTRFLQAAVMLLVVAGVAACGDGPTAPATSPTAPAGSSPGPGPVTTPPGPVHVVLFTHIEDIMPIGPMGSPESRATYLKRRGDLIAMAELARRNGVPWTLQSDWKYLEAARLYEDGATTASTGGRNIFRYLRDDLGAIIDPHSHESAGYNYTDVAHLLDQLGVGGSTVIGGHAWDPTIPQFAAWDRYRVPVPGLRYPDALWRAEILMGAATPGHTNDPVVSGVWRPRNRHAFFEDDPTGNIVSIGDYARNVAGVSELIDLARTGVIPPGCMLTSTYHIRQVDVATSTALAAIERDVIAPLVSLRSAGQVVLTDFTSLVATWRNQYGARGCVHGQ